MDDRRLSPAELAPIVGVSESTLKRWVDAGLLRAEKTAGGHRKIALSEVLAFLRARGRAAPSLEALGLLADQATAEPTAATPDALAQLLLLDDTRVARVMLLNQFRSGRALDDMLDRLVAPAMVRVGTLWAAGTIDVYEEHLATQRAWRILTELRGMLPAPREDAPLALGGAPEGDPYLLPALMAEMTLAELGWRTLNLGPTVPIASLREAVRRHTPRLVWLSVTSMDVKREFFEDYGAFYEAARAAGTSVAIGGQGLTASLQDRLVASTFGTRLAHLKAFAQGLGGR